jgi:hypothetical protein
MQVSEKTDMVVVTKDTTEDGQLVDNNSSYGGVGLLADKRVSHVAVRARRKERGWNRQTVNGRREA